MSRHKPINKMDLQKEIRIALTASRQTNDMLGPFQTWNFLWVPNTYFSRWKLLNTAVDPDVGYDGAEFNSFAVSFPSL